MRGASNPFMAQFLCIPLNLTRESSAHYNNPFRLDHVSKLRSVPIKKDDSDAQRGVSTGFRRPLSYVENHNGKQMPKISKERSDLKGREVTQSFTLTEDKNNIKTWQRADQLPVLARRFK